MNDDFSESEFIKIMLSHCMPKYTQKQRRRKNRRKTRRGG
jgi:hypothetical protein